MLDNTSCTIYDCEFDCYVKGIIVSNIVYAIDEAKGHIPPKDVICEHVDCGMVQFYTGYYNESELYNGIENKSRWGYFQLETGNILVSPEYEYAGPFCRDRACVIKKGKLGYIDYNGSIVMDIIWDKINPGKLHLKHEKGRFITESEPWVVSKDDKWGYITRTGKVITPLIFDNALLFEEYRAGIKKDNKWGFININGKVIIEPVYDEIESYKCIGNDANKSYYASRVKNNDKYGFIDEDGNHITECLYEEACEFWDLGYAVVKYLGEYGLIDRNGEFVVANKFDDIGSYYGIIGSNGFLPQRRWGTSREHYCQ